MMSEDAKEKRKEYMRNWRKNNPDKQKEYQARHWEKKALEDKREKINQL